MNKFDSKGRYIISIVAELLNIHPQTLRIYEKKGLIKPVRKEGRQRLYSDDDLERLKIIRNLTEDLGVNLAGVEVILSLREQIFKLQEEIEEKEKRFIREIEELKIQLQKYQPKFLPKQITKKKMQIR